MKTWFRLNKLGKLPFYENVIHIIEITAEFLYKPLNNLSNIELAMLKNISEFFGQKFNSSFHQFCKNPDIFRI